MRFFPEWHRVEEAGIRANARCDDGSLKHIGFALAILALTFPSLKAQETRVATIPPSFAGTISEFGSARFVVRSETGTEPATYIVTKETKYMDESGTPVAMEAVKSGIAVTVYYTKEGNQTIANKVVVHRAAPRREIVVEEKRTVRGGEEETGIVGEFVSGELTVEVDDSRAPRKYNCNTSTIYLSENGAPVAAETIRAGVPVTVQYSNEGQRRIATKVIVHKNKPVRAVRIEEKRAEDSATETAEKLLKKEEERRKEKLEK